MSPKAPRCGSGAGARPRRASSSNSGDVDRPDPADEVLETASGAELFVEPAALELLDDKILDAELSVDGVVFKIGGWVIVGYDLNDGSIFNYLMDGQNPWAVYNMVPVLAIDVYEHVYVRTSAPRPTDASSTSRRP